MEVSMARTPIFLHPQASKDSLGGENAFLYSVYFHFPWGFPSIKVDFGRLVGCLIRKVEIGRTNGQSDVCSVHPFPTQKNNTSSPNTIVTKDDAGSYDFHTLIAWKGHCESFLKLRPKRKS
jgi:hypothetical protein